MHQLRLSTLDSRLWTILLLALVARGAAAQTKGIWTSAEELQARPMSGPAWDAVYGAAHEDTSRPDVSDQNDRTNVLVLAAAIIYTRTGEDQYRRTVIEAIEKLVADGRPRGRTLAWARETGAYAMAADLVDYRTADFERWLRNMADIWIGDDGRTLRRMFEQRPNNWGSHAFGSLCAIYRYLGNARELDEIRTYWVRGVVGPNPGYKYGRDLSWHADPSRPLQINPAGAVKDGLVIDGLFPDDMRRAGPFENPPQHTNYAWEVQQGLMMAARILDRAGMPIWEAGDKALYRAAYALQVRLGGEWRARKDDLWMLAFYDAAYGTDWSRGQDVWGHGKNTGWAYVLAGDEK